MITLRKSEDRGYADHGWLKSHHSFSFADYVDPAHMGFGNLRVINEDRIAPGTGFGTHGHRDMEIVSVVLEGELAHRDSMGHGTAIAPGEVQRMTAGTGVRHSEFNHAQGQTTHFLQIWLLPAARDLPPAYEQIKVDAASTRGKLQLLAAPGSGPGVLNLQADARLYQGRFDGDERAELALSPPRLGYVHVVRGRLSVNGQPLRAGDAAKLQGEALLTLSEGQSAEVLVFDLAP
jgi:redox-sensitive bicupin YhaK (pirin superfamily)